MIKPARLLISTSSSNEDAEVDEDGGDLGEELHVSERCWCVKVLQYGPGGRMIRGRRGSGYHGLYGRGTMFFLRL